MRSVFAGAIGALALFIHPIAAQVPSYATAPLPVVTAETTSSPSTGNYPSLTGTWTTNAWKVFTGPGFYDPVNEKFLEPPITGISYSFTDDGWYEEAYYRAISNPTTPSCPSAIMQWQHGKYTVNANGSVSLTPISVDGRQQSSDPCSYHVSTYERYHQPEYFQRYDVQLDRYHNVWRLDLYQFNGVQMNPMYLAYRPPQMLPTQTLNPTAASTGAAASSTAASTPATSSKKKRSLDLEKTPLGRQALKTAAWMNPVKMWYAGLGLVGLGSFLYLAF